MRRRRVYGGQGADLMTRTIVDDELVIGGGTSQIQKNIISERGLGMPRH